VLWVDCVLRRLNKSSAFWFLFASFFWLWPADVKFCGGTSRWVLLVRTSYGTDVTDRNLSTMYTLIYCLLELPHLASQNISFRTKDRLCWQTGATRRPPKLIPPPSPSLPEHLFPRLLDGAFQKLTKNQSFGTKQAWLKEEYRRMGSLNL
jgi:hypothetical protein